MFEDSIKPGRKQCVNEPVINKILPVERQSDKGFK